MQWLKRKRSGGYQYPRQFWLLFWGVLVNRISVSMMWPFLTVYMYNKLDVSLTTVTLLLTGRAIASLLSTAIVSPFMDRFGRKRAMVVSLVASACVFAGMAAGEGLLAWVVLVALHGMVLPIFNIGVNTMVADLVENEQRAPAYALIRMISNTGIAIGPVIGGGLALISMELIFLLTAVIYVILAVVVQIVIAETLPKQKHKTDGSAPSMGYGVVLHDYYFLAFFASFLFSLFGYTQMFTLMPVYASENFGLLESEYSLLITVNATMVVLFQYAVTKFTVRYNPEIVVVWGAALTAVGLFSVAFGTTLFHFILSMTVMTMGELVLTPTAMTLVADRAPVDMRARYLGILSLGYALGSGVGPVLGGFLNDNVAPVAIWYGAGLVGSISVFGFMLLARWKRRQETAQGLRTVGSGAD